MTAPDITGDRQELRALAKTIAANRKKSRAMTRTKSAPQVVDVQAELTRRRDAGLLARPLSELLADPALLVEPVEVMPHLLVAGGVTLLSGREKTGKSTLVGYLVSQLTRTRGDS
jgi:hypothetical protein